MNEDVSFGDESRPENDTTIMSESSGGKTRRRIMNKKHKRGTRKHKRTGTRKHKKLRSRTRSRSRKHKKGGLVLTQMIAENQVLEYVSFQNRE
jgi:hypothetical protein